MVSRALGAAVTGLNSNIVTVEADVSNGLPQFGIVGLPDSSVRESRERVSSALKSVGISLSGKRVTVNLAPGYLKKAGPLFDLPIAAAILAAMECIPPPENCLFAGELSLDGKINAVRGVLSIVYEARRAGIKGCVVPLANAGEAALVSGEEVYPAGELSQVIAHLTGKKRIEYIRPGDKPVPAAPEKHTLDYADVKGQELVKRAFAIAAAGRHNILVFGPPGVGKTMLACRLPSIMPPMTFEESVEATKVFSVRGLIDEKSPLITERPFRAVHHTISRVALVGGGSPLSPGEVSLAHNGVLFLDEFAEFPRSVLESLRQPMEDRKIIVARIAESSVSYPADFMLAAASNPCPCGNRGTEKCLCSEGEVSKYLNRISGPLLERIDIRTELASVSYGDLSEGQAGESSESLKGRVMSALEMQRNRFKNEKILFNAQMEARHIKKYCVLGMEEGKILEEAYNALSLSARSYHRILKLARTIADYEGSGRILKSHVVEAISYRSAEDETYK